MSSFNLKIEYPDVNQKRYETNEDGTAKCPPYWTVDGDEFERYEYINTNYSELQMLKDESFKIPFKTSFIDDLETRTLTFSHKLETSTNFDDYMIQVTFSDDNTDYENLYFSYDTKYLTRTFDIPSNAQYIKFDFSYINVSTSVYFYTDIKFEFNTKQFEINTEQNDVSVKLNNKQSRTIDNTLVATSIKKREVFYKNDIIITKADEDELNELTELARTNRLLISMNIDISDEAGDNLANIPSGGSDNIVKYWYLNHSGTRKTGLYSYITINYKLNDENNLYI